MNRVTIFFTFCLLCLSFGVVATAFQKDGDAGQPVQRSYPRHSNLPTLDFKALKDGDVKQEQFNVEGYVASVYECPPCPEGAQCICLGDHVIITETKGGDKSPVGPGERLIIFAKNPKQFEKGRRYLFSVKLVGRKKAGERVKYAELIGYDILEDVDKH